jgi:flagellar hook-associated protein 1 FlgK
VASFGSLNIAYTGLNAHQKRINVIGENVTNVDTPGYHRQRVELSPIDHVTSGAFAGDLRQGGGVQVEDISRLRSQTLSGHARAQGGSAAAAEHAAETLQQIEQIVGGLNPGGLHEQMVDLFNSFDDMAGAPEDPAMRRVVLQRAEIVSQGFTRTAAAIDALRDRTLAEAGETIRSINSLSERIATLDVEVLGALTVDADPNTLLDQRDVLVDQLASLAGVDVVENANGQVTVSLDGQLLVSNGRATTLDLSAAPDLALSPLGYSRIAVVNGAGRELSVGGGVLASQLTAMASTIPDARREIDSVALDLADQINTLHQAGVGLDGSTGLNLLEVGPGSGQLRVSPDVADQPDKLAAARPGTGVLDNGNARELAQLADSASGPLAGFVNTIGSLAARVATANGRAEATAVAKAQADSLALSTGGVSLDEELTDLITAQRAYEASARLMTAIDEMLQTLMTTGLVGR